jgi:hypothetical protein
MRLFGNDYYLSVLARRAMLGTKGRDNVNF